MADLSKNAERALLFEYVYRKHDLPDWSGNDEIKVFMRIADLPEHAAVAAFAELEEAGMIEKNV